MATVYTACTFNSDDATEEFFGVFSSIETMRATVSADLEDTIIVKVYEAVVDSYLSPIVRYFYINADGNLDIAFRYHDNVSMRLSVSFAVHIGLDPGQPHGFDDILTAFREKYPTYESRDGEALFMYTQTSSPSSLDACDMLELIGNSGNDHIRVMPL